ncbi:hypothetical protein LXL04_024253 [Taraxacum kok-saghyz]
MGMLNDVNNNDGGSPFDINDFPQLSSRPSSSGGPQGQIGSLRKQGLGVSPIVQQNQEFSIQNEDFPALPGFKGGKADYAMDLHQKEQLHDPNVSIMQSPHFSMGRSSGFSLGGAFSSHRPQQQTSSVSSFAPSNNQELHHMDMFQQGSHSSFHSQPEWELESESLMPMFMALNPEKKTIIQTEYMGVKMVSFGFAGQGRAIMRGPMVSGSADGVLIFGHSLSINESSMTGESKIVHKDHKNPFLESGCKVADGYGIMLATSVGIHTEWGLLMTSISEDNGEETPLQYNFWYVRLNGVATFIGIVGLVVAVSVLVILLVRFFTGHTEDNEGRIYVGDAVDGAIKIFTVAVTIVVVAVPEGLPLALAYSMRKMMSDKALVRRLSACETMGSATTIFSDKTGTLTLNMVPDNLSMVPNNSPLGNRRSSSESHHNNGANVQSSRSIKFDFFSNVYFSLVVLYILSTRTAFRFFKLFSRHLCFILNIDSFNLKLGVLHVVNEEEGYFWWATRNQRVRKKIQDG